jgi:hypothetical protein
LCTSAAEQSGEFARVAPIEPARRKAVLSRYQEVTEEVNALPAIRSLKDEAEAAQKRYREAFEAEVQKIEPYILEEMKDVSPQRGTTIPRHLPSQVKRSTGYDALTEPERKTLHEASSAAANDPRVQAAREKWSVTKSPEERVEASKEYRKVLREVLLQINPKLEPLLDRVEGKASEPAPKPANDGAQSSSPR